MNRKVRSYLLGATILSGALPLSSIAKAAAAEEGPSATELTEVIVTATRHSQSLQDTPMTVTAVQEQGLRDRAIADIRDLERLAPTLKYVGSTSSKTGNFAIRNVGNFTIGDGFDSSVGVAVDGVSAARPGVRIGDLVDIERVEVSEGPQGMLFGKNATAGLINIITRQAEMDEFGGRARFSYGNFNELQAEAVMNVPVASNVAFRATAWRYLHDGYVTVVTSGAEGRKVAKKDSSGARFRLRLQPTESLDVGLTAEFNKADDHPHGLTIRHFYNNNLGIRDYETGLGIVASPKNRETTRDTDIFNRQNSSTFLLTLDYDVGRWGTLSWLSQYQESNANIGSQGSATSSPQFVSRQLDHSEYDQTNLELRLISGGDQRLRYVVGLNYADVKIGLLSQTAQTGTTVVPVGTFSHTNWFSVNRAVFGELTYDVTEELRLILGGRLSSDKVRGDTNRFLAFPPARIVAGVNTFGATSGPFQAANAIKADEPSWRFGAQYDVSADVMVYATASRGYKAPAIDMTQSITAAAFAATGAKVAPEIATNYEIGLRSQFLDRRVTLNATAFWEVFKDFQTTVRLPVAQVLTSVVNADEMEAKGVQGNLEARLTGDLTLDLYGAYIEAKYTDFENAPCFPGQPTAPSGSPLTPGLCVGGRQSLNGSPIASAPKWRFRGAARYQPTFATGHRGLLGVAVRYQSSEIFGTSNDPLEGQDGYTVVDLQAGLEPLDGGWRLRAYANNVFETNFVNKTIRQANAYLVNALTYSAERTYGVGLTVEF